MLPLRTAAQPREQAHDVLLLERRGQAGADRPPAEQEHPAEVPDSKPVAHRLQLLAPARRGLRLPDQMPEVLAAGHVRGRPATLLRRQEAAARRLRKHGQARLSAVDEGGAPATALLHHEGVPGVRSQVPAGAANGTPGALQLVAVRNDRHGRDEQGPHDQQEHELHRHREHAAHREQVADQPVQTHQAPVRALPPAGVRERGRRRVRHRQRRRTGAHRARLQHAHQSTQRAGAVRVAEVLWSVRGDVQESHQHSEANGSRRHQAAAAVVHRVTLKGHQERAEMHRRRLRHAQQHTHVHTAGTHHRRTDSSPENAAQRARRRGGAGNGQGAGLHAVQEVQGVRRAHEKQQAGQPVRLRTLQSTHRL